MYVVLIQICTSTVHYWHSLQALFWHAGTIMCTAQCAGEFQVHCTQSIGSWVSTLVNLCYWHIVRGTVYTLHWHKEWNEAGILAQRPADGLLKETKKNANGRKKYEEVMMAVKRNGLKDKGFHADKQFRFDCAQTYEAQNKW